MTKEQVIKKYNLKKMEQIGDFDKRYNIERWEAVYEDDDVKKIYELDNEFSRVLDNSGNIYHFIMQTIYKNKLIRIGKTDSYKHKTTCRTYKIKE